MPAVHRALRPVGCAGEMADVAHKAALLLAALTLDCAVQRSAEAGQPVPPIAQIADAKPDPPAGQRIFYPADRPPSLTLPNGRSRVVRSLLNVRQRMRYGDYVWNDASVPEGNAWVRVDLARQTISVFRGPHEIGTAVILYGTDGKPTPTGTFPILAKAVHHRSTLYAAEMPYMLRLTGDGVAIHASEVRERSATHGCIGVPAAFARLLFGTVKTGDPVAILPARDRT